MGNYYSHLSLWERQRMFVWHHHEKLSQREIARRLGRSTSTISRELKRNQSTAYVPTWYPNIADSKYKIRVRNRGQRTRLKNTTTQHYVIDKLKLGWSPEIIAGRSRQVNTIETVSHESIYQFIYKVASHLIQLLPRQHKKRKKKYPTRKKPSQFKQRTNISERPEAINNRSEFGHWESDSIVSVQQKAGCNVLIERKSRLVKITKLSSKTAQVTLNAILKNLKPMPNDFIQSITYDNGSENTKHEVANDVLACDSYFCSPYHSWEKGAVEQVNSLIRRYIPKKMDITTISDKTLQEIENLLNERPRKCLNFLTPLEIFTKRYPEYAKNST